MKTMKKVFIAIVAIAMLSVFSATTQSGAAKASSQTMMRTVTNAQVITYLQNLGYSFITIVQTFADGTRKCTTNLVGYYTYVYVSQPDQGSIVSTQDIAI